MYHDRESLSVGKEGDVDDPLDNKHLLLTYNI